MINQCDALKARLQVSLHLSGRSLKIMAHLAL